MTRWLSVIGIGDDGPEGLSPASRALLDEAEIIIGADRHFVRLPDDGRERIPWISPLSDLAKRITDFRGRRVAVLASGDPMCFGIGSTLTRYVPVDEMVILPALPAFTLAASRLAWPYQQCARITLHGRPLENLALHVHPGARLLILSHDATTPAAVAGWLTKRGFGESAMTVLAHMGGAAETRHEGKAADWSHDVPDLNTIAVECVARPDAYWLPRTAGLPDEAFEHDGKMTKREARALALAKLQPHRGALLWDVGAGCGSVAVEWLRAALGSKAIALEPRAERRAMMARNAASLGVPDLEIRDATAPEGLEGLPQPDAIFIGGGISNETLATACDALPVGGRLVVHAVTLESEAVLLAHHARSGGELIRLSVARAEAVGPYHGWKPAMPVTQWAWTKTGDAPS
jgi:precorrin-6Y C5,15-methyltransferase (decarboxylating)